MLTSSQKALYIAINENNVQTSLELLDKCDAINFEIRFKKDGRSFYPIHLVAQNGMLPVLRKMLDMGCDLNVRDSFGQTPLHASTAFCEDDDVSKMIFEMNPQLCTKADYKGLSPIHVAIQCNKLHLLKTYLSSKVDLNTLKDNFDSTPLHFAAKYDQIEAAKMLMQHGARASVIDNSNCMPRHRLKIKTGKDFLAFEALLKSKEVSLFDLCAVVVDQLPPEQKDMLPEIVLQAQQESALFYYDQQRQREANEANFKSKFAEKLGGLSLK